MKGVQEELSGTLCGTREGAVRRNDVFVPLLQSRPLPGRGGGPVPITPPPSQPCPQAPRPAQPPRVRTRL